MCLKPLRCLKVGLLSISTCYPDMMINTTKVNMNLGATLVNLNCLGMFENSSD